MMATDMWASDGDSDDDFTAAAAEMQPISGVAFADASVALPSWLPAAGR